MHIQRNRPRHLRASALSLLFALGVASAATAAGTPAFDSRADGSVPPPPGKGDFAPVVEAETVELATLHASSGSVITLLAAPQLGDVGFVEVVPAGAQPLLPDTPLSPLEIFLALTPAAMPVPNALVELASQDDAAALAAHRERTDRHVTPIAVSVDDLDLRWEPVQRNNDPCGPWGSQVFEVLYCVMPPIHPDNYLAPITFCDEDYNGGNSVWFNLTRNSYQNGWRQRDRSWGRTWSCNADITVRQQVWSGGAWQNLSTQTAGPGGFIVSGWSGGLHFRRIVRNRDTNVGGFRAFSDFYIFLP